MLIATTLALLATLQGGQQAQDFHWTGTLATGKTLTIQNINGTVTAVPSGSNQVEVTGIKHARRGDPASVQVRVEQGSDGVVICTIYEGDGRSSCNDRRSSHNSNNRNDVAVDFTVRVPTTVPLVASTVNGDVTAKGLASTAKVTTVNGDAEVETRGFAEASSVNGSVNVVMGRANWGGEARYSSVNGAVSVTLPGDASTDVRASTVNGSIETDFPLTVQGRFGPRSVRGTIGSGGRSLVLNTVNGSITIRKGT